jgi:hypothetical protein
MYVYGHFGPGFSLTRPEWVALSFASMARRRGEEITVKARIRAGRDAYGNPTYTESSYTQKAFVEEEAGRQTKPVGDLATGSLSLFLPRWSALEAGWEIELGGARFRVAAVERTRAYLKATAERRVDA